MGHPRQPLQLRTPLRQRNRKDIPLHIPAKDPQQLRPRHMRIPVKLNRRRRRNHKSLIVQQVTPRRQERSRCRSKKYQQHATSKDPSPLRRRQSAKPDSNPRTPATHRQILILIRLGKVVAQIAAQLPARRS
jgi:hypothetical protein